MLQTLGKYISSLEFNLQKNDITCYLLRDAQRRANADLISNGLKSCYFGRLTNLKLHNEIMIWLKLCLFPNFIEFGDLLI